MIIHFPPLVGFTCPPPVPFNVFPIIYIEESFIPIFFLLWIFLKGCPWVKRHIMLTDHVFNDRRDLKSDSAHLSLSRMNQRFYIINQPAFLVSIISQSWNIHKLLTITKKTLKKHLGVVCSMCVQLQRLSSVQWTLNESGGGDLQTLGIHQKTMLWMHSKKSSVLELSLLKMMSSSNWSGVFS